MMKRRVDWNADRIAGLKQRWAAGEFASKIATELLGDKTLRSAVIAKAGRLGLAKRRSNSFKFKGGRSPQSPKSQAKATNDAMLQRLQQESHEATDLPPDQSPHAVRLIDTQAHHCRYPLNAPTAAMLVCGAKKLAGTSYCPRHAAICHNAYQGRR